MSDPNRNPTQYHAIPRKALPDRSGGSLRIARSHSTLWRAWSPRLEPTSEYERSLYKFPWLASDLDCGNGYDDLEGYSSVPQSSLHPDGHDLRSMPTVMEGETRVSQQGELSDASEEGPDPNRVRGFL